MSLLMPHRRGFGGPVGFPRLGVTPEACQREGGSWGRQGFPHAPEPKAEAA
jgi:hypothetical protein